ncbi:MAG: lysophospholipid acyltransferase family protein [Bacteroidota bacterium]
MLYYILKAIVSIGIRLYYREIKVINKKNLPEKGPCIYIANHPNTLMDAWIIGFVAKEPIYFMAKASLFSSPLKRKILQSLNMIPINRREDKTTDGVSNKDSFEACYKILEEGKSLLIFPEGTSFLERHLRELKSGTARIALEVERRNGNKLDLEVIPLGLNYLDANRFGSKVLVQVGNAIKVKDFAIKEDENQGLAAKRLTELFRVRLEQVLVNSGEKLDELMLEDLHQIFKSKYIKQQQKGVKGELDLLKQMRDKITELKVVEVWKMEEIRLILSSLKSKLDKFGIKSDFLDRRFRLKMFFRQIFFSFIFLMIGFPLFIYGFIHNILAFKLIAILIPKMTKDVEYYAPLTVLLGLILYPMFYLAFMFGLKFIFDLSFFEQVIYFSSLPISGLLAYSIFSYFRHISSKWKFVFTMLRDKNKLIELKNEKEKLRKLIFE